MSLPKGWTDKKLPKVKEPTKVDKYGKDVSDITATNWGNLPTVASAREIMSEAWRKAGLNPNEFEAMKADLARLKNHIDFGDSTVKQVNNRLEVMWHVCNSKMDVTNFDDIKERLTEVEIQLERLSGVTDKIDLIKARVGIDHNEFTPTIDARLKANEENIRSIYDDIKDLGLKMNKKKKKWL